MTSGDSELKQCRNSADLVQRKTWTKNGDAVDVQFRIGFHDFGTFVSLLNGTTDGLNLPKANCKNV